MSRLSAARRLLEMARRQLQAAARTACPQQRRHIDNADSAAELSLSFLGSAMRCRAPQPHPDVTAGVAEATLGAGDPDAPLLRLGPGGDYVRDLTPDECRLVPRRQPES